MRAGPALDQPPKTEPSEVVRHLTRGIGSAEQRGDAWSEVALTEARREMREATQRLKDREDARIREAERGDPLFANPKRLFMGQNYLRFDDWIRALGAGRKAVELIDAAEDAEYGADRRGDELPADLQRRESRLKRIREAKRVLEARAKDAAAVAGHPSDTAKPDPKAQDNFTDPESRIMKGPDGFVQAYNTQIAVDEQQLIVGQAVTQSYHTLYGVRLRARVIDKGDAERTAVNPRD
jgi:hypothetical protein